MKRVYLAIVPNPLPAQDDKVSGAPLLKKKRINASVACKHCRAKKAACTGERPACHRCRNLGRVCEYGPAKHNGTISLSLERQVQMATENLRQHADVIERLRSAPETEATAILARLRATEDVSAVLSSIRTSVPPRRIPERRTARAVALSTDTELEFELAVHHNIVYPALAPIDVLSLDLNNLVQLHPDSPEPKRTTAAFIAEQSAISDAVNDGAINPTLLVTQRPSSFPSDSGETTSPACRPLRSCCCCDPRLHDLQLRFWTAIPAHCDFAAQAISHYLETDHPYNGWFHTDLFLSDLVEHRLDHCSAFLVSSLLCLACIGYIGFDTRAAPFSRALFREATGLWQVERSSPSLTTLAAINLLAVAAAYIGEDSTSLELVADARAMAEGMELLGIPHPAPETAFHRKWSATRLAATAHVAWGTYGWLTFHATFFKGAPIAFPPAFPIPGDGEDDLPTYMGHTFPSICKFYTIIQEVLAVYTGDGGDRPIHERVSLAFAESRYQKLLALGDALNRDVAHNEHSTPHVLIFQAFYHISVLDIFRPFIKNNYEARLKSFTSSDASPEAAYNASLNQLKRIVLEYRIRFQSRQYSAWLNAAAQHVCNAVVRETEDPTWRFYFLLCIGYWKESVAAFPVMVPIVKANLSLALSTGCITNAEAQMLLKEVEFRARHHDTGEIVLSSVADFERAVFTNDKVRVDELGQQFEALMGDDSGA